MTVDISKIKPGDKVTLVPLDVVDTDTTFDVPCILIQSSSDSSNFNVWITEEDIAAHHPAPRQIKVDDRVKSTVLGVTGTVKGVDGDTIWVRRDDDEYVTYPVSYLVIIEGDINNEIEISPATTNDGWIKWNGGKCPVVSNEIVEVRFRNESLHKDRVGMFDWNNINNEYDIIAYRVAK